MTRPRLMLRVAARDPYFIGLFSSQPVIKNVELLQATLHFCYIFRLVFFNKKGGKVKTQNEFILSQRPLHFVKLLP